MVDHNMRTMRPLSSSTERGSSVSASGGPVADEAIRCGVDKEDHVRDAAGRPRIARRPQTPTKAEVEAHMTFLANTGVGAPIASMDAGSASSIGAPKTSNFGGSLVLTSRL